MTICKTKMMRIVAVLCLGFVFTNICQAIEKPLSKDDNPNKLAIQLIVCAPNGLPGKCP